MTTTPTLWKSQTQVNTTDAAAVGGFPTQYDAQVVGVADGGYWVVWTDYSRVFNSSGSAVIGQKYDALGNKVGAETPLSSGGANQSHAAVAARPDGALAVAYEYDFSGGSVSTGGFAAVGNNSDPALTTFADDSWVVAYTKGTGAESDIVAFSGKGNSSSAEFVIFDDTDHASNVELATLSNGNFVAVFQDEFNGSATDIDVKFRIFTPTGTAVTTSATVNGGSSSATEIDPDVAALKGGGFVVVWTDFDGDAVGNQGIRASVYTDAGALVAGNLAVNTSTAGQQNEASVVALADGGFAVFWEDDAANFVRGQRFAANGSKIGVEFTVKNGVSDVGPFTNDSPDATLLSDGRIAIVAGDLSTGDLDVVTSIWDPRTGPINGGSGNDTLTSRIEGATVNGNNGDDTLLGLGGIDTLNGGGGNDFLKGGGANDVLDGGSGTDTADFISATTNLGLTLNGANNVTLFANGVASDILRNIENVLGGSGNDTLTGDSLVNILFGGAGNDVLKGGGANDVLDGGAGIDRADYNAATSNLSLTLNGATNATLFANGVANDILSSIENVTGGSGNDTLTGDSLVNILNGGAGNDVLKGGGANDVLDGGAGIDRADYSAATSNLSLTLNGATNATLFANGVANDILRNIENVTGGGGNDTLTGDTLANSFSGGAGNDILNGRAGNDILTGGANGDVFLFNTALNASTNVDLLPDFVTEDTVRLENAVFTALPTGTLAASAFHSAAGATTAHDATDRIVLNATTGDLYYDSDGLGGTAAIKFAILDPDSGVTNADFFVV